MNYCLKIGKEAFINELVKKDKIGKIKFGPIGWIDPKSYLYL